MRKKGKSGNPAKRAEQERGAATRAQDARTGAIGSAFGSGSAAAEDPPAGLDQLPQGFEKFLGR